MKRNSQGDPVQTIHKWSRPPLSCLACREKKRRCDRSQPCSNCVLRSIPCEYSGQSPERLGSDPQPAQVSNSVGSNQNAAIYRISHSEVAPHNTDELLYRIHRLEETLFARAKSLPDPHVTHPALFSAPISAVEPTLTSHYVTPFSFHHQASSSESERLDTGAPSIIELTRNLPPLRQARELVNHFASTLQPTVGVLHVPSTRDLVEKTYQSLLEGEDPSWADLMLLFTIFAGAALAWTPGLLELLNATRDEAMAAFKAYTHYAFAILDHPTHPLQPSTTALVAMGTMAHLVMNTDGISMKVPMLRQRCLLMARELQIHRMDTAKSREERRFKGCDEIDVEVRRRVWWNMVASDWLLSFSGGSQEGAYIFQPKHMNVNLPSNTDDEFITAAGVQQEFPLSIPTSMSAFIFRVKGSELCREVIDALPSILLDSQEPDYDTILDLDAKFQDAFSLLPGFLKLDPVSIEKTREICKERPYIAWQRLGIHFSLHTRLCRLHRHYHLEGITNRKYAYSHMVCIHSAHKVLEIRRSMDEISADVGLMPGRFWTVMHHVFFAALILAMNVSFDPHAPNAAEQKAKVLAAYQTLERSKQESGYMMQGIQKNLQTLMSTLHKQRTQTAAASQRDTSVAQNSTAVPSSESGSIPLPVHGFGDASHGNEHTDILQPSSLMAADDMSDGNLINEIGEEGWQRLWSEFVAVAPELDAPQWNALLEDVDFNPPLDLY